MFKFYSAGVNRICTIQNLVSKLINAPVICQIRHLKEPVYPPLNEEEIREIFAKGSGPGGQKINKATNRCQLKHIPTGIIVSSHHTRSLQENRKIARKLLQQQLDFHFNKESSYLAQLAKQKQEEKNLKTKRSVENLKRKKKFKQEEGLD